MTSQQIGDLRGIEMPNIIELVIKIDENTYNHFVRNEYSRVDVIAMHTALINGTPLSSESEDLESQQIGKRRLIDADILLDKTVRRNRAWNSITDSEGKNLEEIVSEMPSVEQQESKTVLDKIMDGVYSIDDEIVLNPDSVFERKTYVRLSKVMDIIRRQYEPESEDDG